MELSADAGYKIRNADSYLGIDKKNLEVLHLACGTEFVTNLRGILDVNRNPCPTCSKRPPPNRSEAEAFAAARGGRIVKWSSRASRNTTWECSEGHQWEQTWSAMKSYGYWCRACSHKDRFVTNNQGDLRRKAAKCLDGYRRRDEKAGRECNLTVDDVLVAKKSECFYCGRPASGLDRKDNSIGHTKDNCVPACLRCNWMRGKYISHEVMVQVGELLRRIDP